MEKKNIVIIGGGSGSAGLLSGLKKYGGRNSFSVIASMADDGGSTGVLRRELDVSALGSMRKCLLALSEADEGLKKAFGYRFEKGQLVGHVAGNLFMAAFERSSGSAEEALADAHKILKVNGEVIPSSFDKVTLCAELENGETIEREANIDVPKHDGHLKIKKIFLKPAAKANPKAAEKIAAADLIIIGPGDLYTTTLPNFLVPGIAEAVKKAKGKKILIVNSWNKFGETNNFSVMDFVSEVEKYLGGGLGVVIYNSKTIPEKNLAEYRKENPEVTDLVKVGEDLDVKKFIGKDLLLKGRPEFDAEKLVKVIMSIIS